MSKREQNDAPSRGRIILYSIAALFCLFGLADATYLTVLALTGETAACSGQAGCFEVLGSAYSRVAGVFVGGSVGAGWVCAGFMPTISGFLFFRARAVFFQRLSVGLL